MVEEDDPVVNSQAEHPDDGPYESQSEGDSKQEKESG